MMVSGMVTFKVQLWPLKDGDGYTEVEADTPKEAAEQLYGVALNEEGGMGQLRARVRYGPSDIWHFYAAASVPKVPTNDVLTQLKAVPGRTSGSIYLVRLGFIFSAKPMAPSCSLYRMTCLILCVQS
jgi:hypothetical protein